MNANTSSTHGIQDIEDAGPLGRRGSTLVKKNAATNVSAEPLSRIVQSPQLMVSEMPADESAGTDAGNATNNGNEESLQQETSKQSAR